jgi:hypothetical protein
VLLYPGYPLFPQQVRGAIRLAEPPIRNEADNWVQDYSTYFWSSSDPFEMKFEMEKLMRLLLGGDTAQNGQLTYSGSDNPPLIGRDVQIRFEAALPKGNWYSLRVKTWVPRTWYSETEFHSYADKSFEYWNNKLQTALSLGNLDAASKELYDRRAREAMDKETRAANTLEDQVPVAALKQEILRMLRSGRSFLTVHHLGGTSIYFDGKSFVCSEYGEQESFSVLGTEDEALARIRELYDWESRKDSFPHRPPELEVWCFIQRKLT